MQFFTYRRRATLNPFQCFVSNSTAECARTNSLSRSLHKTADEEEDEDRPRENSCICTVDLWYHSFWAFSDTLLRVVKSLFQYVQWANRKKQKNYEM